MNQAAYINDFSALPEVLKIDKNIPRGAKKLYQFIHNLSVERGECNARNVFFAKKFGVTTVTISKWFSALEKYGYIGIENARSKYRKVKVNFTLNINGENVHKYDESNVIKVGKKFKVDETINMLKQQVRELKRDLKELLDMITEMFKVGFNDEVKSKVKVKLKSKFKVLTYEHNRTEWGTERTEEKNAPSLPPSPQEIIFKEKYPDIQLNVTQIEDLKAMENLGVLRKTIHWWVSCGYRGNSIGRIKEKYDEFLKEFQHEANATVKGLGDYAEIFEDF